jgi:hypothetical protein
LNVALTNVVKVIMKYIASCSCGKDSLAMVLGLIEKIIIQRGFYEHEKV